MQLWNIQLSAAAFYNISMKGETTMPSTNSMVKFRAGTSAAFAMLAKDGNTIYFCTDTKQIFVGASEYTKGAVVLESSPDETTKGDNGRLYVYNGNLYLCQYSGGTAYSWTRVANVNDRSGTVTSIGAGEGLDTTADSDNPITSAGTIVHAVPKGAQEHIDETVEQSPKFGESFNIESVATDKFGHVISVVLHSVTLPDETALTVTSETSEAVSLNHGDSFTVVTEVTKGANSHEVVRTQKTFNLPQSAVPSQLSITYDKASDTVNFS